MNFLQIHEPGQTPLPHETELAIGIDLGTTHSVAAIVPFGMTRAEIIPGADGEVLLPSVVQYSLDGVVVGTAARAAYERGERQVIASVKRLMGRSSADVKTLAGSLPYDIVPGDGLVRLKAGGREVTPVEVSAEILKALKWRAEEALDKEVARAVITVPAYFDDAARAATKDAARLAGLEVLRLINEPTAAALAYGLDKGLEGVYAVYDLGGGTFDISLLKLEQGVFQVLATAGNTQLGGDDVDQAIAAWMLSASNREEIALEVGEIGALVSLARAAKHQLTTQETASIDYNHQDLVLTCDVLAVLAGPYIDQSIAVCEQALLDAGLSVHDVKGVVMVGGSTRMKLVNQRVADYFGQAPLTDINPDEAVAIGAALQAHQLSGEGGDGQLLIDVIPLSLGLETMGGLTEKLLSRNTPIPTSVTQEFTTWQDGQGGMQIHVVQGEREMASHNRSLARFELTGIPPLPAGIARVAIAFVVDADGLLTVEAREKTTGLHQAVHVKPSYGLSPDEMEKMLIESMENARRDISERLLVEARVEAGRSVAELESALARDGQLLGGEERRRIERQMQVVRQVTEGDDRDYIDAEAGELARVAQAFAEKRMDSAIASALKGSKIDAVMKEVENP